jgi:hypothetical protein
MQNKLGLTHIYCFTAPLYTLKPHIFYHVILSSAILMCLASSAAVKVYILEAEKTVFCRFFLQLSKNKYGLRDLSPLSFPLLRIIGARQAPDM